MGPLGVVFQRPESGGYTDSMQQRYPTFDAMRGIAAVAVVLLHAAHVMPVPMFKHAYLAVDFFFMLSGFVLAVAYESKLRLSLSFARFLELRLVRLYPLFLLGVILGAVAVVGQMVAHSPSAMPPAQAATGFFLNSLMIPIQMFEVIYSLSTQSHGHCSSNL